MDFKNLKKEQIIMIVIIAAVVIFGAYTLFSNQGTAAGNAPAGGPIRRPGNQPAPRPYGPPAQAKGPGVNIGGIVNAGVGLAATAAQLAKTFGTGSYSSAGNGNNIFNPATEESNPANVTASNTGLPQFVSNPGYDSTATDLQSMADEVSPTVGVANNTADSGPGL